jgi:hypothetical protein
MTSTHPAGDLGSALRTAFDTFETIRELARQYEDADPGLFAAFISAGTAAADGRDALAAAPALTHGTAGLPAAVPGPADDAADAAEVIAVLASALSACLADAAGRAVAPQDRRACQDAAAAARQIRDLMAGPDDRDPR